MKVSQETIRLLQQAAEVFERQGKDASEIRATIAHAELDFPDITALNVSFSDATPYARDGS